MTPKTALILAGGWEGHHPELLAVRYRNSLRQLGFEVTISDSLKALDFASRVRTYDLIVPNWTMGTLTPKHQEALCDAVRNGTGLAGCHGGMGDTFRASLDYIHMVGGHFVAQPYVGPYTVRNVQPDHPLTRMLPERFVYDSEQYYLQVDPGVNVLLATECDVDAQTVAMPVAWTRKWGLGRVFYCSLGHHPDEFEAHPAVWEFIVEGCRWAGR